MNASDTFTLGDHLTVHRLGFGAMRLTGPDIIPWYPMAAGGLDGPVADVAAAHDASPHQVALAWLLAHSEVLLPIPGTSSREHLEENIAASQLELTDEEYARLAALD